MLIVGVGGEGLPPESGLSVTAVARREGVVLSCGRVCSSAVLDCVGDGEGASDASDDEDAGFRACSCPHHSSSPMSSKCAAVYLVVRISSSSGERNATCFAAGNIGIRPSVEPATIADILGSGLLRRHDFKKCEGLYGTVVAAEAKDSAEEEESLDVTERTEAVLGVRDEVSGGLVSSFVAEERCEWTEMSIAKRGRVCRAKVRGEEGAVV